MANTARKSNGNLDEYVPSKKKNSASKGELFAAERRALLEPRGIPIAENCENGLFFISHCSVSIIGNSQRLQAEFRTQGMRAADRCVFLLLSY